MDRSLLRIGENTMNEQYKISVAERNIKICDDFNIFVNRDGSIMLGYHPAHSGAFTQRGLIKAYRENKQAEIRRIEEAVAVEQRNLNVLKDAQKEEERIMSKIDKHLVDIINDHDKKEQY